MRAIRFRWLCLVVLAHLATACSLGWTGTSSGGDENLPILGAGPFAKPTINFDTPAEEPYVVVGIRASLTDPTAVLREGGGFQLWYGRQADDEDEVQIWTAGLPGIYELNERQEVAMVASEPWEEGRVAAPAVVRRRDGTYLMLYEGGVTTPSIGLATSIDGLSWDKHSANPVIVGATSPGLGDTGTDLMAVFTRPGVLDAIFAADSDDGGEEWTVRSQPIITARVEDGDAFDIEGVASPALTIRETVTGRLHFGLHFNGTNRMSDVSIGYAASFDGRTWERFLGPDPVVSDNPPVETGPALVVDDTRAYLFFSEPRQLRGAIAVGVDPKPEAP